MKRKEKTAEIKVKPKRLTRAERKRAKLAERTRKELALCRQNGEFHRACLQIDLDVEKANLEYVKAQLEALEYLEYEEETSEPTEDVFGTF